jgi:hypothetical protein
MKKFNLLTALFIVFAVFCSVAHVRETRSPSFSWTFSSHDFGKIKKGHPVTIAFRFINSGGTPLLISGSKTGCGYTTTSYSNDPIAPGKDGNILVTYNAASTGIFNKTIYVTSNASEIPVELTITGEVVE